jgi:hypothetical protein
MERPIGRRKDCHLCDLQYPGTLPSVWYRLGHPCLLWVRPFFSTWWLSFDRADISTSIHSDFVKRLLSALWYPQNSRAHREDPPEPSTSNIDRPVMLHRSESTPRYNWIKLTSMPWEKHKWKREASGTGTRQVTPTV